MVFDGNNLPSKSGDCSSACRGPCARAVRTAACCSACAGYWPWHEDVPSRAPRCEPGTAVAHRYCLPSPQAARCMVLMRAPPARAGTENERHSSRAENKSKGMQALRSDNRAAAVEYFQVPGPYTRTPNSEPRKQSCVNLAQLFEILLPPNAAKRFSSSVFFSLYFFFFFLILLPRKAAKRSFSDKGLGFRVWLKCWVSVGVFPSFLGLKYVQRDATLTLVVGSKIRQKRHTSEETQHLRSALLRPEAVPQLDATPNLYLNPTPYTLHPKP